MPTASALIGFMVVLWLLCSGASKTLAQDSLIADAVPPSSASVLASAFTNRYEVDLISKIELIMRNRSGQERRRLFHAVSKTIEDRVHSVGRLVKPEHLRGMTIMTIEKPDRSHDAFVYLPSLDKVRRVSNAQRGDSFLGSDVTYEDLERRRVEEYELGPLRAGELDGEPIYRIEARPTRSSNYARSVFAISQEDGAILSTEYYKRDAEKPFRVISAPREHTVHRSGRVIPTYLKVTDVVRGTSTEVFFSDLRVNPEIDERVFTAAALESGRRLPGELRSRGARPGE